MPPKEKAALVCVVETDEELENLLCQKGLKVVEVYSEWCGPCKSVLPTFKRIRSDKEDEAALLFVQHFSKLRDAKLCAIVGRGYKSGLFPPLKLPGRNLKRTEKGGRNGLCSKICAEHVSFLEAAKEHRGKSLPVFLLYRNGMLKHKVEGANTPLLSSLIAEHTPVSADVDDLEMNPLFLSRRERLKAASKENADAKGKKK